MRLGLLQMITDFEPIKQRIAKNLEFLNSSVQILIQTAEKMYQADIPESLHEIEDYNSIAMNNVRAYMQAIKQLARDHEMQMNTHIALIRQHEEQLRKIKFEIDYLKRDTLQNQQADKSIVTLMQQKEKEEKLIDQETERLAHLDHYVKEICQQYFLTFDQKMIRHKYPFIMGKKRGREIPLAMPSFYTAYIPPKWYQMWERQNDLAVKNEWNQYYCQVNQMNDDFYAAYAQTGQETQPTQQEYQLDYAYGQAYDYDYQGNQRDYYNE